MSNVKECWKHTCSKKGKDNCNIEYTRGYTKYKHYTCKEHKQDIIYKSKREDWKIKFFDNKVCCSLILCKECLENVEEVLNY